MSSEQSNPDAVVDRNPVDKAKAKHRRFRKRIAENKSLDLAYRITVGVVGTLVLALGVLAIPYPGPGWLIVFAGLGILASEFEWAKSALRFVRKRYDAFMAWFSTQSIFVKGLGVLFTTVVVLVTLWLLGTFALVGGWLGLDWSWLNSPI
ncbi:putative integral membrane protein [Rhodococcus sp. AW25M09]|uniref:TIGR02611 family protein n=1 Tax=Rhodococcus sp. AW25M09 TaxID=1268303 RepID=UPI0002ABB187|nr:TIGR02611 family protein [Rhodococcus sp. AW25M09]CCQ16651.1 putative integral membrane protein [Rhodococcus sp. AW25M09]